MNPDRRLAVAGIGLALVALMIGLAAWLHPFDAMGPSPIADLLGSPAQADGSIGAPDPAPDPTETATTPAELAASETNAPVLVDDALTTVQGPSWALAQVDRWWPCGCTYTEAAYQLKVQVHLALTSDAPFAVDASASQDGPLFLAVDRAPDDWTADWRSHEPIPAHGPISINGLGSVILLPPNQDGHAHKIDGSWTWATHWPERLTLEPGETFYRPEPAQGDLVFEIPEGAEVRAIVWRVDTDTYATAPIEAWPEDPTFGSEF